MHLCTHTYTQTHPPACACKHARKHVLVKSTHVGHAMGWRANAHTQMPRGALPKAPRDKMRCAGYDKRRARQNARAVGKCTGHELSSQGPLRDRRCPSSHYLEPLLSSQATCKHHISHWHAGRETRRSRLPRLLACMQRTCSFLARTLPMSKHASLPAVGVAFTFTSSLPTRKPASVAWPPPLNPVSRCPLVATAPSHERILSQAAQDRRPCMSRIARAPPINHAALQCKPPPEAASNRQSRNGQLLGSLE